MKTVETLVVFAVVVLVTHSAQAQLIDDFESGDASPYTTTVILNTDFSTGANTSALGFTEGNVKFDTTAFDTIEQLAMTRSDVTLGTGEELQLDVLRGLDADRGV